MTERYMYGAIKAAAQPARSLPAPLVRAEAASAAEWVTDFLTRTPKQLKIPVSHTKQTTAPIPNRDTNTTPRSAICRGFRSVGGISGFGSPMDSTGVPGSDLPAVLTLNWSSEAFGAHAPHAFSRSALHSNLRSHHDAYSSMLARAATVGLVVRPAAFRSSLQPRKIGASHDALSIHSSHIPQLARHLSLACPACPELRREAATAAERVTRHSIFPALLIATRNY